MRILALLLFAGAAELEDDLHVCLRGFDEARAIDASNFADEGRSAKIPLIPVEMSGVDSGAGPGNQGAFWDQVCSQYKTGHDILADPYTALSAIPAATPVIPASLMGEE